MPKKKRQSSLFISLIEIILLILIMLVTAISILLPPDVDL